ncbi:MAG: ATP-binding cassette domain-containing protein [Thiolinea sp.]
MGKSTLLELIAGFIHPDSGDICWQGQSLLPLSVEQRPVSMLFQTHNLFEHISVLQNLQLGWPERVNRERDSRIRSAAGQLGVGELLLRSPASLSGGQRQRIACCVPCCVRNHWCCWMSHLPTGQYHPAAGNYLTGKPRRRKQDPVVSHASG